VTSFFRNRAIQANVIGSAYRWRTKRLLFLGSSCIYPKLSPQPIKEEYLLSGPREPTNRPYALVKIAGVEMRGPTLANTAPASWQQSRQISLGREIATTLHVSHMIPGLLRKMHEAKISRAQKVEIWGAGNPRTEFLYSEDAADACVFLMNLSDEKLKSIVTDQDIPPLVNIGCGKDQTIGEIAELIAEVVGCDSRLDFDLSKPDGTPRKLLNISRLATLGWKPKISFREGLKRTYQDFSENIAQSSRVERAPAAVR
jgi:GDP-L-fucose synthase